MGLFAVHLKQATHFAAAASLVDLTPSLTGFQGPWPVCLAPDIFAYQNPPWAICSHSKSISFEKVSLISPIRISEPPSEFSQIFWAGTYYAYISLWNKPEAFAP